MRKFVFLAIIGGGLAISSVAFAQSATLYFTPSSGTFAPGQTFRATIMVNTQGQNVNAVAAYFTYPADKLDVQKIDTAGSAMSLIAEPRPTDPLPINGRVNISGGTPTPGFSGVQKIAAVDFRVKAGVTGQAVLAFTSGAAVLRDSDNQNILSLPSSQSATIQITQGATTPPPPPPPTPDPTLVAPPTPTPGPEPTGEELQILDLRAERVGPNSIQIFWETNKAANARVDYGPAGSYAFSVLAGEASQEHSVLVIGLDDAEAYQFQIKSATAEGEVALLENVTLEDLITSQEANGGDQEVSFPDQVTVGGFEFTATSLILFAGLPVLVFMIIAFLVIRRIARKKTG
ncbi:MAG TPA: hypothetical protein VGA53_00275 [Candidatus Paceibacterota bacterium]